MKNKTFPIFAGIIFIWAFPIISACNPDYTCEGWSSCQEGFQLRTCTDHNCNLPDIYDRRICTLEESGKCTVNYKCDEWTRCAYFDKTNDILNSQISYSGVETRSCLDTNGCVDSFFEERTCRESFKVDFITINQCGLEFLVAQDPGSKRSLAKINLDAWRQQFLDLSFIQGNFSYCPSCYNSFKDENETGVDCGGGCKICNLEENHFSIWNLLIWFISIILFISFFGTFLGDKKYALRFVLFKIYFAMEQNNFKKIVVLSKKMNSLYLALSDKEKNLYSKEILRCKSRLAEFKLRVSRKKST